MRVQLHHLHHLLLLRPDFMQIISYSYEQCEDLQSLIQPYRASEVVEMSGLYQLLVKVAFAVEIFLSSGLVDLIHQFFHYFCLLFCFESLCFF